MLERTKAVIFDLDGTLMDSMWMWSEIDAEYLSRYGFTPPEDLGTAVEGMSFTETAQYFRERFSIPESPEEICAEWNRMAYEKYAHRVQPKPGVPAFLAELKRRSIPAGIASSSSRELILACLSSHRIENEFACILTCCEVASGKPAPDIYLAVAERMGAEPQDCLVFEDVPNGARAGKSAGMRVCAVADVWSAHREKELRAISDYFIRSYDEISAGTYETLSPEARP